MDEDSDENMIDCEGIGDPVFVDKELTKFYTAFKTDWLYVTIGDCVRINLANNGTGFGQVLAIFEDAEEEMFIEVRWFVGYNEVKTCKNLKSFTIQSNELFESDELSDISAGAVSEIISLKDSIQDPSIAVSSYFICRLYKMNSASGSLCQSNLSTLFQRGISKSSYHSAYASYLESYVYNHQTDDYSLAIQRLHISVIPDNLPCREQQREMIMQFIKEGIVEHGSKKPLYVCGTPGTGKTATVIAVITALQKQAESGEIPSFHFVEINCLRLKNPTDAYTQLWRGISGDHESSVKALKQLKGHFNDESRNDYIVHRAKTATASANEGAAVEEAIDKSKVVVCLLDELDYLITRDFEVMYNFFNWPRIEGATIVIVGIANTMDLPEKLQSKIESRSGLSVNRLTFHPYKFNEVQQILQHRLSELKLDAFDKASIEFMARKAETVGGDLRAALKICQRTIELFRDQLAEEQQTKRASKVQRVVEDVEGEEGNSVSISQNTTAAAAGAAIGKPKSNFDKIKEMVLKAVESYKQNPFIAVVSRSTQLEKVILIILVRSRRHDDNENPDAVDSEKGLTLSDTTERVSEMVGTIINEQKLTSPVLIPSHTAAQSVFVDLIPEHSSVAVGPSSEGQLDSESVHRIYLLEPSERVVKDALGRLCRLGLVQVSYNRLLDEANAVYTLHKSFMLSNLTAALKGDPLHKYCSRK